MGAAQLRLNMRGIKIDFKATGAELAFNESVDGFMPTVQNAVVFTGQKKNTDAVRPEKGTNLLIDANRGGMITAGHFMQTLAETAIEARIFSIETDTEDNPHILEKFSLELDEWFPDAARIKIGAKSITGEEITTDYTLS
jgi:hypothetical protein